MRRQGEYEMESENDLNSQNESEVIMINDDQQ